MQQNRIKGLEDPSSDIYAELKEAIPKEIREFIIKLEENPLQEEILGEVYKNRYNPDMDYYYIFGLVRPYLITSKISIKQFEEEFKTLVKTGIILETEHSPKAYTTSPFANECMVVEEMLETGIVNYLYRKRGKELQTLPPFKDVKDVKKVFRSMVRSLLYD